MKPSGNLAFGACLALLAALPAGAATLFDGSGLNTGSSTRPAGDAPLGHFQFAQAFTLTSISQRIRPEDDGALKFVIFEGMDLMQPPTDVGAPQGSPQAAISCR